jgi:GT2 family glycosyltransferase
MNISIIIVNYNTSKHLEKCLSSIYNYTDGISFEIIVVDNNSKERGIENIKNKYAEVKFIFLNENNGFGAGCNVGASSSNGDYLVFINPDVLLVDNTLMQIYHFMISNPKVGVSTGILKDREGNCTYTYNHFPGLSWEFTEAIGRGSKNKISKLLNHPDIINKTNNPIYTDWVIGAFMFVRTDVYKKIKGFDEDFFLYYEDVEIQKRIRELGYKIAVLPNIFSIHSERSSVRSFEGENIYYFHMTRSKLIYYYKHSNLFLCLVIRVMHLLGLLFRMSILAVRRAFKGKKKQKLFQYKFMIKLFLLNYNKILISKLNEIKCVDNNEYKNSLLYDDFWK